MEFIFLPLDLPSPPNGILQRVKSFLNSSEHSYWDSRRHCQIYPLRTPGGQAGLLGVEALEAGSTHFEWVSDLKDLSLVDYVKEHLEPWMEPMGNVAVIHSEPGKSLTKHIDTSENKFLSGQTFYKFRYVLSGSSSNLWFETQSFKKCFVPNVQQPYLIDGSRPHGTEPLDHDKFTLCIGNPWEGQRSPAFEALLQRSIEKHKAKAILRNDI